MTFPKQTTKIATIFIYVAFCVTLWLKNNTFELIFQQSPLSLFRFRQHTLLNTSTSRQSCTRRLKKRTHKYLKSLNIPFSFEGCRSRLSVWKIVTVFFLLFHGQRRDGNIIRHYNNFCAVEIRWTTATLQH